MRWSFAGGLVRELTRHRQSLLRRPWLVVIGSLAAYGLMMLAVPASLRPTVTAAALLPVICSTMVGGLVPGLMTGVGIALMHLAIPNISIMATPSIIGHAMLPVVAAGLAWVRMREMQARTQTRALEQMQSLVAQRVRQAEQFAATLARVGAADDVQGALEALLRGAVDVLSGVSGAARLFDPATGDCVLLLHLLEGGRLEANPARTRPQPGSMTAHLRDGGDATFVGDYHQMDPATYPGYRLMLDLGLRSSVNVPIRLGERCIGTLAVHQTVANVFGQTEVLLAEALATQAGAAIERARLAAAQQDTLAAQARMDGALLVARTVAHEINNALTRVVGGVELLAMNPGVMSNAAREHARMISEGAQLAAELIAQLQQIVRLEEVPSPLGEGRPVLDLLRSTASGGGTSPHGASVSTPSYASTGTLSADTASDQPPSGESGGPATVLRPRDANAAAGQVSAVAATTGSVASDPRTRG